jgi:hypothetical protein
VPFGRRRPPNLIGGAIVHDMSAAPVIDPSVPPSGTGCVECLATDDGWWFHLRRCAACGHIGCCDSSPSQHARHHAADAGHPIATSYEPGETWFWDFAREREVIGPSSSPRATTRSTSPCPDPRAGFRRTGSTG